MKAKIKKVIKVVVAIAAITAVALIGNEFVGNPITKYRVVRHAEEYIKNTYPGTDYVITDTYYEFKNCDYYVEVESAENDDIEFKLTYKRDGRFVDDDFEFQLALKAESRFNEALSADLEQKLREEFEEENGGVINITYGVKIYIEGYSISEMAKYYDEPVDLDNFPFEIDVNVTVRFEDSSEEKVNEVIDRVNKIIDGKYIVNEYTVSFCPDADNDITSDIVRVSGDSLTE